MLEPRAVACHEAAHAVAARKLDVHGPISYVELDTNGPPSGKVVFVRPDNYPPVSKAEDTIVQQLVGAVAECRVTGEWEAAKSGAEDDYERVTRYARGYKLIPPSTNPPEAMLEAWEAEARSFVANHWSKIEPLANALLAARITNGVRTLSGNAVERLL